MRVINFLGRVGRVSRQAGWIWKGVGRLSYAQCGEDHILAHIFACLGILKPRYLDIGAHAPAYLNNTYYFYLRGSRGVLVEPDPALVPELVRLRPGDTCLNVGVGAVADPEAPFYVMSSPLLNSFSKAEAERYERYGTVRIVRVLSVPVITVTDLLARVGSKLPNLVSIDVEGYETDIIRQFNFEAARPEVFCIETLTYTEDKSERKNLDVGPLLAAHGYFAYADTYINTIYVDRLAWNARP
jgi:FkbM family methyltransferase